jgi:hypothetical protein
LSSLVTRIAFQIPGSRQRLPHHTIDDYHFGVERTEETLMTKRARGAFEVQLVPEPSDDFIGRMSIDKHFKGDLEANSKGQMLSSSTEFEGSAGYVAMERVSGTLHGRRGTFVLQHNGAMNRGVSQQTISVVPDSGTGELVGLAGKMTITVTDGRHSYDFEYSVGSAET